MCGAKKRLVILGFILKNHVCLNVVLVFWGPKLFVLEMHQNETNEIENKCRLENKNPAPKGSSFKSFIFL